MIFDPVIPVPWIAGIALLVLGMALRHQWMSARHLGVTRSVYLTTLRLVALAMIVFILLQPSREEKAPVPAREKSVIFAIDESASMAEAHRSGSSRIDAVRADLEAAGVLHEAGGRHRFVTFAETARPASPASLMKLSATGETTRFDTSIAAMLRLGGTPEPAGLIVLSDGHDFDMVPAGDTARRTRSRDLPVFTIAYGTAESSRDISLRISNYHPHTFVRQKTRLEALVRATGCPHESLAIDLLCDGKPVKRRTIDTGLDSFHTVSFDVMHEEAGQHEYTFRAAPVANERELSNNTATTYLNVISERIRILEIEGAPFWDSTFLRRSFARNDKFEIDSLVAFTGDRVRPIRSNPERNDAYLLPPANVDDLKPYDLVVLGRDVERVIGADGIRALDAWVKDHGGIVVFSRGRAWLPGVKTDIGLEPIVWDTGAPRGTRLEVTPQAGSVPAFRLLREVAAVDEFPEVIAYPADGEPKTLATTFSVSADKAPAVVYRRYGNGQTLSLGVGNLWRWVFNPKATYDNNAYDRFWDQLSLWLLANGGVTPIEGYSLRADTSNLPLGETLHLRFSAHGIEPPSTPPVITLTKEDAPVTTLNPSSNGDPNVLIASFTPRETGRYTARCRAGDKLLETHFMVFRDDVESIETAMDRSYLEQLAKASGGRMINAAGIRALVDELLRDTAEQAPLIKRISLWDRAWIFWLLGLLLAMEWYARRRWGLT
jgi:hypothetical protein